MAPFKNLTMSFLCLVCPVVYLIKHLWACPAVTLTRPSATNHSQVINIVFPAFSACEPPSQDPGHFLELLASSQSRRLDDQRVSLSHFPGLRFSTSNLPRTPSTSSADQVPTQGFTLMRFHLLPLSLLTLWLMPFFFLFFSSQCPSPAQMPHTNPPCTASWRPVLSSLREMKSSLICWLNARWEVLLNTVLFLSLGYKRFCLTIYGPGLCTWVT